MGTRREGGAVMRAKYGGLVAMGLFALVTVATVAWAWWLVESRIGGERLRMARITPVPVYDAELTPRFDELTPRLARLTAPGSHDERPVDLSLLGYRPRAATAGGTVARDPATPVSAPIHRVAMAFVSERQRYCVIDDRGYRVGDHLEDGTRVARIERKAVELEYQGVRYWAAVEDSAVTAVFGEREWSEPEAPAGGGK